jgi:SCP-2 sterol transfer family
VAEFLSESWIVELDQAARDASSLGGLGSPEPLVVEQRVHRGDDEVVYHLSFSSDGARVRTGPAAAPDLIFVTDLETARRLQQGTLSAQQAAVGQKLKIRGQVQRLGSAGEALRSLDDVFQTVRDATTYPAESGGAQPRR